MGGAQEKESRRIEAQLEQSRTRLLERGPALIVPGHGEPFTPA